ncbi:RDD family protein [Jeotgalibacillus aurantiacus]|uniref:RDD family protein n=1 Tax=Jeotgalibacillus aurantiacus TaxID=2763266 RepID=UPI001D0A98CA|nr:RDD family protein [Jeotgalibacillus aurantiacus]
MDHHEHEALQSEAVPSTVTYEPHYGGFWIRVCAYLFDLLVIAALNGLLIEPAFRLAGIELTGGMFSPINIATGIVFFAYFVLMTKILGQTLGKMIFGLRVVALPSEKLSWVTVLFRELIGRYLHIAITFFSLPVFLFLYGVVAFTPKKQGIHDLLAETTVIHERTVIAGKPEKATYLQS